MKDTISLAFNKKFDEPGPPSTQRSMLSWCKEQGLPTSDILNEVYVEFERRDPRTTRFLNKFVLNLALDPVWIINRSVPGIRLVKQ